MPRQWNGSEWVNFKETQPGYPLHHDEKGADKHNEKLKKSGIPMETEDEFPMKDKDVKESKKEKRS